MGNLEVKEAVMERKRMVLASILGGGALLLSGAVVQAADDRAAPAHRYHSEFLHTDQGAARQPQDYGTYDHNGRFAPARYDRRYDRSGRYPGPPSCAPRYGRQERREYRRQVAEIRHEYEKAMQRLDRQEHESREWVSRQYGSSHPHFHERMAKIDRKFAHKREKVERRAERQYRELAERYGSEYTRVGYGAWGDALTRR